MKFNKEFTNFAIALPMLGFYLPKFVISQIAFAFFPKKSLLKLKVPINSLKVRNLKVKRFLGFFY